MTSTVYLHEPASRQAGRPVLVMSQTPGPGLAQLERVDVATSGGTCSCSVPASGPASCSCSAALSDDDLAFLRRILARVRALSEPATSPSPSPVVRLAEGHGDPQAQLAQLAAQVAADAGVTLAEAYRSVSLSEPALYHRARTAAYAPTTPRGLR